MCIVCSVKYGSVFKALFDNIHASYIWYIYNTDMTSKYSKQLTFQHYHSLSFSNKYNNQACLYALHVYVEVEFFFRQLLVMYS